MNVLHTNEQNEFLFRLNITGLNIAYIFQFHKVRMHSMYLLKIVSSETLDTLILLNKSTKIAQVE